MLSIIIQFKIIHTLVETYRQFTNLKFTNLETGKQGPAIVLSLEGEAQDEILELDKAMIFGTGGVDKIIEW